MASLRNCSVFLASVLYLGPAIAATVHAEDKLPPVEVQASQAATEAEMKPYSEIIEQTDATIDMLPIPGGKFMMGSPEGEADRIDRPGGRTP